MLRRAVVEHVVERRAALGVDEVFFDSAVPESSVRAFAVQLELGALEFAVAEAKRAAIIASWQNERFRRMYMLLAVRTIDTFRDSPLVRRRILEGELDARGVAALRPEEAFPELWRESVAVVEGRREEARRGVRPMVTTTVFTCSRCRKNECTFREIQLRSADEPMTIFIACLNCGHRWKQ